MRSCDCDGGPRNAPAAVTLLKPASDQTMKGHLVHHQRKPSAGVNSTYRAVIFPFENRFVFPEQSAAPSGAWAARLSLASPRPLHRCGLRALRGVFCSARVFTLLRTTMKCSQVRQDPLLPTPLVAPCSMAWNRPATVSPVISLGE